MKRFVALYLALDASTSTLAKVAALKRYLADAPVRDAAWAVYFLSGRKPRQAVPSKRLRQWARELAGIPEWLFDETYHHVGDLAETVALLLPPATTVTDRPLHEWVSARLLALPFAPQTGCVAGYWASDGEIALHVWQLRLPAGVRYCLPVLHDDGRLRFAPWRPGEPLVTNRYGIPEPETAELLDAEDMALIVMPLVGFDDHGQRLGMGGGWYDRTLAFRRDTAAPPWLVGAGFALQHTEPLIVEQWDVALDAVCTEAGTRLFAPNAA